MARLLARPIAALLLVATLVIVAACGSDDDPGQSQFWDANKEILGNQWDFPGPGLSLAENVEYADAIVTVRVNENANVELPSHDTEIFYADPADRAREEDYINRLEHPSGTTYEGTVRSWIKGSGDGTIRINTIGGVNPKNGAVFFLDQYFLLEPQRTYLLLLHWDPTRQVYQLGDARNSFDITDGVKVLNHPFSHNLDYLETLSVDEFVARIEELAAMLQRDSSSPFWDVSGDVIGSHASVWFSDLAFDEVIKETDATVRIEGIHDVELPNPDRSGIIYEDPADKEREPACTEESRSWSFLWYGGALLFLSATFASIGRYSRAKQQP